MTNKGDITVNFRTGNTQGFVLTVAALLLAVPGAFVDSGGSLPMQDKLPGAEQILDQYVEAIGGLPALGKVNNRVTKGTMEIAGAGVKLSITTYQARPNRSYTVVDSPATGKIESGTNGEIAWQVSALTGAQLMEGKEKANLLHMNIFDRVVDWRTSFQKVEAAGVEDVSGKPCCKVVVTPKDLPPQTMFFDKETRLLVRVTMTVESQAGTIPSDSYLSDYKAVDGVLLPHKIVTKLMNQERVTTMESIEHNVQLPADRLEIPAQIKALRFRGQAP